MRRDQLDEQLPAHGFLARQFFIQPFKLARAFVQPLRHLIERCPQFADLVVTPHARPLRQIAARKLFDRFDQAFQLGNDHPAHQRVHNKDRREDRARGRQDARLKIRRERFIHRRHRKIRNQDAVEWVLRAMTTMTFGQILDRFAVAKNAFAFRVCENDAEGMPR